MDIEARIFVGEIDTDETGRRNYKGKWRDARITSTTNILTQCHIDEAIAVAKKMMKELAAKPASKP